MEHFIRNVDGEMKKAELLKFLEKVYEGFGTIPDDIKMKYKIILPETEAERDENLKYLILGEDANKPIYSLSKKKRQLGTIIELKDEEFG